MFLSKTKIKKLLSFLVLAGTLFVLSGTPSWADSNFLNGNNSSSTSGDAWNSGITAAGTASGLPSTNWKTLLFTVLKFLLTAFIILSFISFVVYGIMFLMAGVNKDMHERAKDGVLYSILGLVVAFSAYIIITLINSLISGTASSSGSSSTLGF